MLIGFAAVCLYLLLALLSYSPDDPGWSRTGAGGAVSNVGGPAGAWIADVFLSLFGYLSYLFLFMLGYQAWRVFRLRDSSMGFDGVLLALRAVGLSLVMVAGTGLASLYYGDQSSLLPFSHGGILGAEV